MLQERGTVRKTTRAALPWLGLGLLALALRTLSLASILQMGAVRFQYGADELYHMRRIWFSVVNFPASLGFDRYVNFPHGGRPPWTPLFDVAIAALARLLVGRESQGAVELVAACVPPVLGAATVIAAAALARRAFSRAAGWTTGLLLAALPVHIGFSELAALDHHVAVGLGATLLVFAAMRVARRAPAGRWPAGWAASAAIAAGMLLLWPGSLLHCMLVQLVLVGQLLLERERASAVARARSLAALHGLAALLLAPACFGREWEQYGPLSPLVLSSFQPLWFGAGALTLALLSLLWTHPALAATRPRRAASALLLAIFGLVSAWFGIPGLRAAVVGAAGWFEADPFLAGIAELQPLLFPAGFFDPSAAQHLYSYFFWAYPLAAAWLMWRAVGQGRAEVALLVVWSSVFFCTAVLAQRRFNDTGSVGFALVVGCALAEGVRQLGSRLAPAQRIALAGALVVTAVAGASPAARDLADRFEQSLAALRDPRSVGDPLLRQRYLLERVARFLHRESPPTQGYLDTTGAPEYGVLSTWDSGHLLRYYAERPVGQDNFGPYAGRQGFDLARAYYASRSEADALAVARELRARYVVSTAQGSGQLPITQRSMAAQLLLRWSHAERLSILSPLAHHRLIFATDDIDLGGGTGETPWIAARVFEIVPGALVTGRAPAGALVRFRLLLRLADDTPVEYAPSVPADESGRYEIRLPYPTDATAGASVRSEGSYAVRSGERARELALSESDIRAGTAVEGPSFAP